MQKRKGRSFNASFKRCFICPPNEYVRVINTFQCFVNSMHGKQPSVVNGNLKDVWGGMLLSLVLCVMQCPVANCRGNARVLMFC